MEYWHGTIKEIEFPENVKTFNEKIAYMQNELNIKFHNIEEEDEWAYSDDVELLLGKWYRIDAEDEENSIVKMEDGSYKFSASFYNGGTCLIEVLEHLLREANEGDNK